MTGEQGGKEELLKKLAEVEAILQDTKKQQKIILDNMPFMVWLKDKEGRYLVVSRAFGEMFGLKPEEIIGRTDLELFPKELAEKYRADDQEVMHSKESKSVEEETQNFAGKRIRVATIKSAVYNDAGEITGTTGVALDITERRMMEEALRDGESRFRSVIQTATDAIICGDLAGNIFLWNESAEDMYGYTPDEMIGQSITLIMAKPYSRIFETELQRFIRTGQSGYIGQKFEATGLRKDGTEFPIEMTISTWRAKDEDFYTCVVRDITESKEAEAELLDFTHYLDKIINSVADPIFVKDSEHRWVLLNDAFCEFMGYKREQLIGKSDFDFFPRAQAEVFWDRDELVFREGKENINEEEFTDASAKLHTVLTKKSLYIDKQGERFIVGIIRDITERKEAEEDLLEFNNYLEKIINSIPDPIFVKDRQHRLVLVNDAECRLIGRPREEVIGRTDYDFFPKEQVDIFWDMDEKVFDSGKENINEEKITDATGVTHTVITKKNLYADKKGRKHLVGIIRDVTEQNKFGETLKEGYEKLQRTLIGTADALATALEKRDPYTAGHEKRVAKVACAIAAELGFSEDQINGIRITAFLHDIGKIVVPAEILSKPSKLNEYEYSIVKTHPEVGYDILKGLEFPWPVAKIVLQHHERLNGSGYPNGLKGEAMLREAKILAVSDVVEAMVSHRPYRPAKSVNEALEEITRNKGILYDSEVVNACVAVFREKHFTFDEKPKNEK